MTPRNHALWFPLREFVVSFPNPEHQQVRGLVRKRSSASLDMALGGTPRIRTAALLLSREERWASLWQQREVVPRTFEVGLFWGPGEASRELMLVFWVCR